MSPTQRSLALLRRKGWTCQVVERWNAYAKVRQDVFKFGDIIAIKKYRTTDNSLSGIALVQSTSGSNLANRINKIQMEPLATLWKECGGLIIAHGWRKLKPRGKRAKWEVIEEVL